MRAPFPSELPVAPKAKRRSMFTSVIDVEREPASLPPALSALLGDVAALGGNARVLVVDSVSDGYGLGTKVPRAIADAVCKLTEAGVSVVVLEENAERGPSPWCFAAELVVELGGASPWDPDEAGRLLSVSKNRFGPCDSGPHVYDISKAGVTVYPRGSAYLAEWSDGSVLREQGWSRPGSSVAWTIEGYEPSKLELPPFQDCVTAVHGGDTADTVTTAMTLGTRLDGGAPNPGWDVIVDLARTAAGRVREAGNPTKTVSLHDLTAPASVALRQIVEALEGTRDRSGGGPGAPVRRVVVGDLGTLRSFTHAGAMYRMFGLLGELLRRRRIPLVLYETGRPALVSQDIRSSVGEIAETGEREPQAVDFSDVSISLLRYGGPLKRPRIVNRTTGSQQR